MAVIRGYDTGGTGGSGTSQGQSAILAALKAGTTAKTAIGNTVGSKAASAIGGGSSSGGATARSSSSGSSSGGSAASSSTWGCPSGATLIREPGGTGSLVCRWNHNGAIFAAQPKSQTGGGTTTALVPTTPVVTNPEAVTPPTVTAPAQTAEWLQAAQNIFASDPQSMLAVRLKDQYGDSGGNSLYGMLEPYADAANAMYLAQVGTDGGAGTTDAFLGYLDNYWKTLQTPGARLDTGTAINNIMNAPAGSPLAEYLTQGDPSDQANNALRLFSGALQTGYHPSFANSVMDRLRLERDRYLGEAARGGTGSYIDFIRANVPNVANLFG